MSPTYVSTPYGPGIRNPRNPLSSISLDEDTELVGYDNRGMPIYRKKKDADIVDMAKEEAKKEAVSQGKKAIKDAVGGGTGLAALVGADAVASGGVPATPQLIGATRGASGSFGPANATMAAGDTGFFTGNSLLGEGAMGIGDYIPGIAGAYGLYDLYQNREDIGTSKGYLQGAASGAGIGWTLGGPIGAGIGAGAGILANAFGIGGESRTKGEEKARDALAEQGIVIPNSEVKEWENNPVFAKSRQEKDLVGKDIVHAADLYGIRGYADLDPTKQEAIAQEALNQGLVREKLGKIDLSMTPQFEEYLAGQLGLNQPQPTGGSSNSSKIAAEIKKDRKKKAIMDMFPTLNATPTQGPRYDQNPGNLINNPYL